MRKRRLNSTFLSQGAPSTDNGARITASNFVRAFSSFASEYLKGICELEVIGKSDGYVDASPIIVSYAIKLMLAEVEGDGITRIVMSISDTLDINVTFERAPSAKTLSDIISRCTSYGFNVNRSEMGLAINLPITSSDVLKIYAMSESDLARELKILYFM